MKFRAPVDRAWSEPSATRRILGRTRLAAAVGALVLLGLGGRWALEPSSRMLAQAVQELGPLSGWRCARLVEYVYDPRREPGDRGLFQEAPEAVVVQQVQNAQVVRVEANLQSGETVVSANVASPDGTQDQRVYVLTPGRLQAITVDLPGGYTTICNSHLANWRIVAEHELG